MTERPAAERIPRRGFFYRAAKWTGGIVAAGLAYAGWEASDFQIVRRTIPVADLPRGWHGARVALLSDIHHGPFTGLPYIERIVRAVNAFEPDVVALTGDFSHRGARYVEPCFQALLPLRAKLSVLCVPGNHEYYDGIANYRRAMAETDFVELTNRHTILTRDGDELAWAGLDDYLMGNPDPVRAMQGVSATTATILLAHNPDQALACDDPRMKLQLSGHTHGGQIVIPFFGPPLLPTGFISGYVQGLYDIRPGGKVYVSRGLGTITPPLRLNCPPELTLIDLASE